MRAAGAVHRDRAHLALLAVREWTALVSRRLRSRLVNLFPWLGLPAVACGALGTLITLEPPSLAVQVSLARDATGPVPPLDVGRGPSIGAVTGLALGAVSYLLPPDRAPRSSPGPTSARSCSATLTAASRAGSCSTLAPGSSGASCWSPSSP